jgi:endonuclease/exonuclease/phosphatase family metal-dependent hydrolase
VRPPGGSETTEAAASSSTASASTSSDDTSAPDSSETGPPIPCEGTELRVVTFNVEAVGTQGSPEWEALADVLARLAPDVACIEELGDFETDDLSALAEQLGWGPPIQAAQSPAIGGELRNACLGPRTMNRVGSYDGAALAPDGDANDLSRDVLAVRVDLDAGCHANVLAIHAKSGQEDLDRFRRQVEFVRFTQAIARVQGEHPGEAVVLAGDFNENPEDENIGQVFASAPPGLPESYQLGADISFPLTYDPFGTFEAVGMTRLEPTAEDSTSTSTWGEFDGFRIDYMWITGAELDAAIVYDACQDDGVDAPPAGAWLPLTGEPLPCATSDAASDHLPIAADLRIPAD